MSREQAVQLHLHGATQKAIELELGVSRSTVRRWINPEYEARARADSRIRRERNKALPLPPPSTPKRCSRCQVVKPLSEFHKWAGGADGHQSRCRTCAQQIAQELKEQYPEKVKQWQRDSDRRNRKKRNEENNRWRRANPGSSKAHMAVLEAIAKGDLVRPNKCSRCSGEGRIEGHHEDYSRPLDIEWLCQPCHRAHHRGQAK